MSALSTYLENKLVDHVLRNTAYTTPGTSVYVGLVSITLLTLLKQVRN